MKEEGNGLLVTCCVFPKPLPEAQNKEGSQKNFVSSECFVGIF